MLVNCENICEEKNFLVARENLHVLLHNPQCGFHNDGKSSLPLIGRKNNVGIQL